MADGFLHIGAALTAIIGVLVLMGLLFRVWQWMVDRWVRATLTTRIAAWCYFHREKIDAWWAVHGTRPGGDSPAAPAAPSGR